MKPSCVALARNTVLAIATVLAFHRSACGQSNASEASLVPVAISVALPVVLIAGVGSIVVTGVQASAEGTVWLVENVADGVTGSICFAGGVVGVAGLAVGTVIVVTAVATGTVLSTAGHVIAFIPNEIGRTLSYNQRVSK